MAERPSDMDDVVEDGRDGPVIRIHVRPRSRRRGVLGVTGGAIAVGVGAPPEGGKATEEALRTLARWLGVAPSRLRVVSGETSRSKRVLVAGETVASLRRRIAADGSPRAAERGERRPDNGP